MHTLAKRMAIILAPFIGFAAIGLILSLVSHGCALLGLAQPLGDAAWRLHVGIFVVWLPVVLVFNPLVRDFKRKDFWKAALRGCPTWMRWTTYGFLVYAVINFITFMLVVPGIQQDIDPENCWFEWQRLRRELNRKPDLDLGPRLSQIRGFSFRSPTTIHARRE